MSEWMNSRAEAEMQAAGKKIMEEAAKRAVEDKKVMGKWTITLKGNSRQTEEEVKQIMDQLVEFAKECDKKTPNLDISIDPVI